jgi:hypothetical protein
VLKTGGAIAVLTGIFGASTVVEELLLLSPLPVADEALLLVLVDAFDCVWF